MRVFSARTRRAVEFVVPSPGTYFHMRSVPQPRLIGTADPWIHLQDPRYLLYVHLLGLVCMPETRCRKKGTVISILSCSLSGYTARPPYLNR